MKKSNAIGSRVSSKRFDFSNRNGKFAADISEVSFGGADVLDQLYHDSADKGFVMVSAVTGDEAEFILDHTEREADGDIRFWLFKPSPHAVIYNKKLTFVSAIIYNT